MSCTAHTPITSLLRQQSQQNNQVLSTPVQYHRDQAVQRYVAGTNTALAAGRDLCNEAGRRA